MHVVEANDAFYPTVRNYPRLGPLRMSLLRRRRMQIESAVLCGLKAALFGEIAIKKRRVEQRNFGDYLIARMGDAPVIETHFAFSGGKGWGGVGEPGTPAIANAIFARAREHVRSLSLTNPSLGARSRGNPPLSPTAGASISPESYER